MAEKTEKTRCTEYKDGIPILGNVADLGTTTRQQEHKKHPKYLSLSLQHHQLMETENYHFVLLPRKDTAANMVPK